MDTDTDETELDNYFEEKIELDKLNSNIKEKAEKIDEKIKKINVAYKDLIIALITDNDDDESYDKILDKLKNIVDYATGDNYILMTEGEYNEALLRKRVSVLAGFNTNDNNNGSITGDEMEVIDQIATLENTENNNENPTELENDLRKIDDTGTDTDTVSSEFERKITKFNP